jgi:predicted transcriptional regulator
MAREAQDITEAELALLEQLWSRGAASIRQITDALYPGGGGPAQYATVQKQLERMEAKGVVRRDRSLYVHVFSPAIDRDELIGRRLRAVADTLCGGSLAPILSHLAKTKSLSEAERRALRELIEEPGDEGDAGTDAGVEANSDAGDAGRSSPPSPKPAGGPRRKG